MFAKGSMVHGWLERVYTWPTVFFHVISPKLQKHVNNNETFWGLVLAYAELIITNKQENLDDMARQNSCLLVLPYNLNLKNVLQIFTVLATQNQGLADMM